ncbi:MAG: hypothetical protein Ta2B_01060 [Termitinemataceae bacterium]|nr:MAG: hypothetical protein Ta2B_01060 [Termitinemataceae bacterium]
MPDLTEEEYDALDEKWTKNPPTPGPNGTGFFAQRKAALTAQSARSITVLQTAPSANTAAPPISAVSGRC